MLSSFRYLLVLGFFALVSSPSVAVAADDDAGLRAKLTMRYVDVTDVDGGPDFEPFVYPEVGFTWVNEYLFLDASTPLPVVIMDGIATLFSFAASGNTDLPIMSGLNSSDEAGWITIFELSGGPVLADFWAGHFGAGIHFEYAWLGPTFEGERVNNDMFDVGAKAHMFWPGQGADLAVGFVMGNGFQRYSNFNPFVQLSSSLEVQIYGVFWLALSGSAELRHLSFTDYEPPFFGAPEPSAIPDSSGHFRWAIEFGPSFHF